MEEQLHIFWVKPMAGELNKYLQWDHLGILQLHGWLDGMRLYNKHESHKLLK